jgi:hypothetical protein
MNQKRRHPPNVVAVALLLANLLVWPMLGSAGPIPPGRPVTGHASAVQATVFGNLGTASTSLLANSGTLTGNNDVKDASELTGSIPSLLDAEVLSATTLGYPDEVDSEASLGNLAMTIAGVNVTADSVVADVSKVSGAAGSGNSFIQNLAINGVPITITGEPNQTMPIAGGQMVINEQTVSPTGAFTVNAIHVTVIGMADVLIASATAGVS